MPLTRFEQAGWNVHDRGNGVYEIRGVGCGDIIALQGSPHAQVVYTNSMIRFGWYIVPTRRKNEYRYATSLHTYFKSETRL
jgi:hypothetical protein